MAKAMTRRDEPRLMSRRSVARLVFGGALLVGVQACSAGRSASPAPHHVDWGIAVSDPNASRVAVQVDAIEKTAGRRPTWIHVFAALDAPFPGEAFDAITAAGAIPLLTLEPWNPSGGVEQPDYSLARIAAGAFDSELSQWGTRLALWGKRVLVRFAHEMNGTWYPWAVGVNGNTSDDYRQAWSRMYDTMRAQGAGNVQFVWAPNVVGPGTHDFTDAYPGPDRVDYLGVDGYNWGDGGGYEWRTPQDIFDGSLAALRRLQGALPILITEVGCAEDHDANRKAKWITDFVAMTTLEERLTGFVWFDINKERDWRVDSTPQSAQAFRAALERIPNK